MKKVFILGFVFLLIFTSFVFAQLRESESSISVSDSTPMIGDTITLILELGSPGAGVNGDARIFFDNDLSDFTNDTTVSFVPGDFSGGIIKTYEATWSVQIESSGTMNFTAEVTDTDNSILFNLSKEIIIGTQPNTQITSIDYVNATPINENFTVNTTIENQATTSDNNVNITLQPNTLCFDIGQGSADNITTTLAPGASQDIEFNLTVTDAGVCTFNIKRESVSGILNNQYEIVTDQATTPSLRAYFTPSIPSSAQTTETLNFNVYLENNGTLDTTNAEARLFIDGSQVASDTISEINVSESFLAFTYSTTLSAGTHTYYVSYDSDGGFSKTMPTQSISITNPSSTPTSSGGGGSPSRSSSGGGVTWYTSRDRSIQEIDENLESLLDLDREMMENLGYDVDTLESELNDLRTQMDRSSSYSEYSAELYEFNSLMSDVPVNIVQDMQDEIISKSLLDYMQESDEVIDLLNAYDVEEEEIRRVIERYEVSYADGGKDIFMKINEVIISGSENDILIIIPKRISTSTDFISGDFKVVKKDPIILFSNSADVEYTIRTPIQDGYEDIRTYTMTSGLDDSQEDNKELPTIPGEVTKKGIIPSITDAIITGFVWSSSRPALYILLGFLIAVLMISLMKNRQSSLNNFQKTKRYIRRKRHRHRVSLSRFIRKRRRLNSKSHKSRKEHIKKLKSTKERFIARRNESN